MRCIYPGCKLNSTKSWALVPLCDNHHETIHQESALFYSGRRSTTEKAQRSHYLQIAHLIPWSKVIRREGDWK